MDRRDILRKYHVVCLELGLYPSDVILSAGGACVLHGLRDTTNDLDLEIPYADFWPLARSGVYRTRRHSGNMVLYYQPKINIQRHSGYQTTIIEGVRVYTLEALYDLKTHLNRPKDQEDLEKLRAKLHQ